MLDLVIDNTYLVLLLPLWIFLIIMCGRFFAVYVNKKIIYALTLLSSLLGGIICGVNFFNITTSVEQSLPFIKINDFVITFGLRIDKLSLIIAALLFFVSFCVQIFSITYMRDDKKNYRFFAYLNMFNFSMAGLLFSPNLFQMYVFWELVGVMSYLLIGFDYKEETKSAASRRVFLMNRVGDTALIAGIIMVSYFMYNYAGNTSLTTLAFEDMNVISTLLYAYTSTPMFYFVCALFIIGAGVKSAQFPFYTWLQDAMEAKLPVSALLHSATMVISGVYLLIRLIPAFSLDENVLHFIALTGILTAILCSILASFEVHPKKVLAYSTSANLGLMFFSVGILNIKACLILLLAHAILKSTLFLSLDIKNNLAGYIVFVLSALSLSGLLFSGLIAKEFLYASLTGNLVLKHAYCVIAFLGAFYLMRLAVLVYKSEDMKKWSSSLEFWSVILLAISNIGFYFVLRHYTTYSVEEPFGCALAGWAFVYILYKFNKLEMFKSSPRLLEKFYNNVLPKIYDKVCLASDFVERRFFANYKPVLKLAQFGVKAFNFVELNVMNKSVSLIASASKKMSEWDSYLQSKNVQTYNAYAFILITIIVSCVIIAYTMLVSQFS